ncbi:sensor histidine kinase [Litorilituus lipolyticus]|uniref:Histidine kinase n=1 Tax=Litorilituus lipolyticus TaxID=2491017 RepID=A0A502KKN1_9GAMM|nr:histidine kinase [Litorilituus lipolyticus]TPH12132.1 histidine kinase [Litorilituus lipolyticus]
MNLQNAQVQPKEENLLDIEPQAFSKQSHQFWTIQITGWLGYFLVVFIAIIRPQFDDPNFDLTRQLINLFAETFSGFCLSYLQWQLIQRVVHLPLNKMLIISFTSSAVLGLLYNVIKLSCYKVIVYQQQWNEAWDMLEFGGWLLFSLSTMFVWTSIFFIMLYNHKLQKEHAQLLRAQTLATDAQLQMLRYQLNPHFMFNTMNAISTLIYKHENDKANEMLDKLCEFFRYSLDFKAKSKTSLKKELDLLALYLSIEKVRFGDRLNVEMVIKDEAMNCQVPNMLLQPLVENAIKYAIEPIKEGGMITIKAYCLAQRLNVQVIDNGQGIQKSKQQGFGIGISNTKARLDAMFNGDYEINLLTHEDKGVSVNISMPIET